MSGEGSGPATLVADLHLRPDDPGPIARFERFLGGIPSGERLFVLGDLFDVWVGPRNLAGRGYAVALDALALTSARGVRIEALLGNRDFLLDCAFERRTGVSVVGDEKVTDLAGKRALLLHGDTLCSRDFAYQRYRRLVRSSPVRGLAKRLPLGLALLAAGGLRRRSVRAVAAKLPAEKSIVPEEAARAAAARGCDLVVCGHAHEESVRRVGGTLLVVLPAWGEGGRCLEARVAGLRLVGERGERPVEVSIP